MILKASKDDQSRTNTEEQVKPFTSTSNSLVTTNHGEMLHPFFDLDTVKVNGEVRWCCPNDEIYDRHWRKSTLSIHCNESNATIGRCEVSKTEQENWAEFHSATAQFNHYQLGANSRDALFIYAEKPFTQTMRKNRWPLSGVSLDSARKRVQIKQTFLIL